MISVLVVKHCLSPPVIRRVCGQTLGLGLGQIRYSSSSIISLRWERERAHDWEVTWHDVIGLEESRESLGLGWRQGTWVSHSVHIIHIYMMKIKEYDVRAHGHGMLALRKTYSGWVMDMRIGHGH